NLITILKEGRVRAGSGMIRGNLRVVCLFDVALPEFEKILDRRNRRRYESFGVAVDKRYAFKMGARPVIYLPAHEAKRLLPAEELWRVVRLDMDRAPAIDWTFEREWRLNGDLPLDPRHSVTLVADWRDADEVYQS